MARLEAFRTLKLSRLEIFIALNWLPLPLLVSRLEHIIIVFAFYCAICLQIQIILTVVFRVCLHSQYRGSVGHTCIYIHIFVITLSNMQTSHFHHIYLIYILYGLCSTINIIKQEALYLHLCFMFNLDKYFRFQPCEQVFYL